MGIRAAQLHSPCTVTIYTLGSLTMSVMSQKEIQDACRRNAARRWATRGFDIVARFPERKDNAADVNVEVRPFLCQWKARGEKLFRVRWADCDGRVKQMIVSVTFNHKPYRTHPIIFMGRHDHRPHYAEFRQHMTTHMPFTGLVHNDMPCWLRGCSCVRRQRWHEFTRIDDIVISSESDDAESNDSDMVVVPNPILSAKRRVLQWAASTSLT